MTKSAQRALRFRPWPQAIFGTGIGAFAGFPITFAAVALSKLVLGFELTLSGALSLLIPCAVAGGFVGAFQAIWSSRGPGSRAFMAISACFLFIGVLIAIWFLLILVTPVRAALSAGLVLDVPQVLALAAFAAAPFMVILSLGLRSHAGRLSAQIGSDV